MGIKLIKCRTTTDTNNYFFLAPKGTYTGQIATASGVFEAEAEHADQPNTPVKELLLAGTLKRIHCRATKGGKTYTLQLLARKDKVDTISDEIKGKTIGTDGTVSGGATIARIVTPRRATTY